MGLEVKLGKQLGVSEKIENFPGGRLIHLEQLLLLSRWPNLNGSWMKNGIQIRTLNLNGIQ
jgi:hypothetical protein